MKNIVNDTRLVAHCGLYCGACEAYIKGRCPSCHENVKAQWCKVRSCCIEYSYSSCASCREFSDPNKCGKYNNTISKIVGFLLNSNRRACIEKIKESNLEDFAAFMSENGIRTIPRRKK